ELCRPDARLRRTRPGEHRDPADGAGRARHPLLDLNRRPAEQDPADLCWSAVAVSEGAWLARIAVYPLKSFDPTSVEEARVFGGAGLEHDREYKLVDENSATLNGKKLGERLIRIRSTFDLA